MPQIPDVINFLIILCLIALSVNYVICIFHTLFLRPFLNVGMLECQLPLRQLYAMPHKSPSSYKLQ